VRVETKRTKPTIAEFCAALRQAAPSLSRNAAGILWAQFATETGRGQYCWNWNLGNVKWSGTGPYMALKGVWEIIGGKRVLLPQENRGSWFRAYATLDEGMTHHIEFLRGKRYASVWPTVEAGDPVAFAEILKAKRYYTAPLADYTRSMCILHAEFLLSAPAWEPIEVDGVLYMPEQTIVAGESDDGVA
jgi:flagellum-specific peptidoglycan hydrolase FlgJ